MKINLEQALESHYLFHSLSNEARREVLHFSRIKSYKSGSIIFAKNEPTKDFFIVLSGEVRLFFSTPDGKEKTIKMFRPQQSFAEAIMFLNREIYPANAMALCNTELLAINGKRFIQLLMANPELCLSVLASLAEHVHTLTQQVEMLSVFDAKTRVLIYLNKLLPPDPKNNQRYLLATSKKQIAEYLAIRPETLSRILKQLEKDKVFIWQKQYVELLNWQELNL